MNHIGEIILTNDISNEVQERAAPLNPSDVRIYEENEIQIKHIHEIIAEAHIASQNTKTIIIAAHSFRHEAQNALLKILEEPPENIKFLLITRNKTAFLPTIRSRLLLNDLRTKDPIKPFCLDINKLTLQDIYNFIRELAQNSEDNRIYGRNLVASVLHSVAQSNIHLDEEELMMFDTALLELENYRKKELVCLPLLLMLYYKTHPKSNKQTNAPKHYTRKP